ncbi:hypothetical protein EHI8A_008080 [Entamoeba histolytica HM-1:IMSS-B]|uniref:Uncharacterized protein n=6 Tax=Entamoeba histolytica TaxID=5759 RepID=C4M0I1_ENTH1|nr:hypothetical protein EHI_024360 [Entamoeba histolytica HM-1:IMSS]EMD44987.1 Hypothetical protein EHI5A_023000 [Entamoeba histolytica KU27]EMH75785.1 hypothetical protein EHI8A_008080 [Entamoeba histolytica HM-1:IMSS-B]EMS11047.1 hypothetical protein KM1_025750 [Entamoeba histolytica HM-3:IMSS]ENY65010.1 hypothetical protein EHI7A_011070 [Entamoeba histolytica HM-1:IMSS-A]GAT94669.1 hypothetical protein CL6EHI_024360 [Entamoeba histolytica]|eukprot:XP_650968.1 hypothetical protein EHI_024360 [Entamoeba histolytica HM-1:IMSS]
MEGCKKDQRKLPSKLLITTLNSIQSVLPNSTSIYVVSVDSKSVSYIGSFLQPKKKREKKRNSSSRESVSFEEVLDSLSQLIVATVNVGKTYEETDTLKTMHLQGRDSMISIIFNKKQSICVVIDSNINELCYVFDDQIQIQCQPIFDALE